MPFWARRRANRRWRKFIRRRFTKRVRRVAYSIAEKKYFQFWINAGVGSLGSAPPSDYVTSNLAATTSDIWRFWSFLNGIQQGAANNQRIGNNIFVRYVHISLYFVPTPAANGDAVVRDTGSICRYVIVRDRKHGGGQVAATTPSTVYYPAPGDQYWDPAALGTGAAALGNVLALRNNLTMGRYQTYLDMQHVVSSMSANATDGTMTGTKVVQHFIKVFKPFQYRTVGSVTDFTTASDSMAKTDLQFGIASNAAGCCRVTAFVRVCYNDA